MNTQDQAKNTILVVDDDTHNLETVSAMLINEGYVVHCASDGRTYLESARQITPDLILMDAAGPGSEATENYRRMKADPVLETTPVILMSSNDNSRTMDELCKSGTGDFIRKPLNRVELLRRIDLLLTLQKARQNCAEAQQIKGVLETAGSVCHSLNQPLQYVLGAVQILLMDLSPEDKMFKSLDMIREKVEQMGAITRKLSEVTRFRPKS